MRPPSTQNVANRVIPVIRHAIGSEVQVPEVADVEPRVERGQHVGIGERAARDRQRLRRFGVVRAIRRAPVLTRGACTHELPGAPPFDDERHAVAPVAVRVERRRDAQREILGDRHARIERDLAGVQAMQRAAGARHRARREAAPAEQARHLVNGVRREIRAVAPGRKRLRRAAEHGQPRGGRVDLRREYRIAPVVARIDGLDRATARVVQRPAEIEILDLVPPAAASRRCEAARQRAARVKPTKSKPARAFGHDSRKPVRIRQAPGAARFLHPRRGIEQQMRIVLRIAQAVAQHGERVRQFAQVGRRIAADGQRRVRLPRAVDEPHGQPPLRDAPGLANPAAIETDEVRRFAGEAEQDSFGWRGQPLRVVGEPGEIRVPVDSGAACHRIESRHHAPPKTSTPANMQAGAAWPTRMICAGSPFPQYGVP